MTSSTEKPVVLAVDDTPENLDVVKGLLSDEYVVKAATSGAMALKIVEKQRPDLILLDIMMPGMSGYEVCEQLKANPDTCDIPVIFLTAMEQTSDEAQGFELGAADYITKPVNPPILKARVRTHILLKQSMDELHAAYAVINTQKERMEGELNVARDIQLSMVPATFPAFPDREEFFVHGLLKPAREIGGDFYDYFFVERDKLCVCVGDVSGKGVPAALFMAVTKTMIKSTAGEDHSPASIMTRVNDEISNDNPNSMFITLFLGILDTGTGKFCYTNAGHPYPLIRHADGTVNTLKKIHGPVVGAIDGIAYGEDCLSMGLNDLLLVFTDGITEAMDVNDELFGDQRVFDMFDSHTGLNPDALVQATLDSVETFAGDAEQADDITVLALRYNVESQAAGERLDISINNQLTEIDVVNDAFNEFAERCDISLPVSLRINMVFDELLNNVISYAYEDEGEHSIDIVVGFVNGQLTIDITDDGLPYNPFTREAPDTTLSLEEREIGGLGVHLVKNAVDETLYQRRHDRNTVTLIKKL